MYFLEMLNAIKNYIHWEKPYIFVVSSILLMNSANFDILRTKLVCAVHVNKQLRCCLIVNEQTENNVLTILLTNTTVISHLLTFVGICIVTK